ncbi:HDA1 complex subunit 3 [Komagataella phaffii CBS 7435]|uniref:Subunit of a possibly tetrameric trichostatin A-sensitive class II histone deacetylase complex n=2 Tax=Komagataella phaffii TaxID=460519 RepID=C4R1V9_KOMPG|nr:Subunit of a possibly tetrameric trichostatin A-sensitive class II histone deacetylase complex [Komagataella phaffii GS115]AOA62424.1 GQ67_00898T0 [Komagataella phaffii]CAH2447978.1 HDA1 complex subunit 3 [Komagataella phaffii CBS 7435]AOA67753.1 GQ68_00491T0 [Komagataella phaffii GS115]CAY69483.1 Subunit of a possibly tetrameric trichostatin A-sensitive class II histone deacetylase complex [Komagataella phaffii GS115]CCA38137.1 HDA1 complex subunit 3 [Komagataella phaffii CBS 7435]
MDLLRILDTTPEPPIIDPSHFNLEYDVRNGDYRLITPLSDFQKELIDQIVSLHYSDILKFYERIGQDEKNQLESTQDQVILDSLETLLLNTQLVVNHPYLLITHYMPKSLVTRDISQLLSATSGKFKILGYLMESYIECRNKLYKDKKRRTNGAGSATSSPPETHIVVVSRPGKTVDLLEGFLTSFKVNIRKYHGTKPRDMNRKLHNVTVHLIPSKKEEMNKEMMKELLENRISVCFLFDITCLNNSGQDQDMNDFILALLFNKREARSSPAPMVRLVPINTVDHIAIYFREKSNSNRDSLTRYLKPMIAAIVVLRDRVGVIPSELRPIYATNLSYLNDWLSSLDTDKILDWPLPQLPSIPEFTSLDVEMSLLTEVRYDPEEDQKVNEHDDVELVLRNMVKKQREQQHILYYELKRLVQDYLTNPLKIRNVAFVIGIHNMNDASPLQSRLLTHTLIHQFGVHSMVLRTRNDHLRTFDCITKIRNTDVLTVYQQMSKIADDINVIQRKMNYLDARIGKASKIAKSFEGIFTCLKNEVVSLPVNNSQVTVYSEFYNFQALVKGMRHRKTNLINESTYLKEQIDEAIKSTNDSHQKLEVLHANLRMESMCVSGLNYRPHGKLDKDEELSSLKDEVSRLTCLQEKQSNRIGLILGKINDTHLRARLNKK